MASKTKVAVLGLWHLGTVYAACLADLGYRVTGWDSHRRVVTRLNKGLPPLMEPGLTELVRKHLGSAALRFTTDIAEAVRGARLVFIAFDTPVNEDDTIDLTPILQTSARLPACLPDGAIIVISSQVPIGTCEQVKASIQRHNKSLKFDIVYMPENLKLGQAIQRFIKPDMLVLGADSEKTLDRVISLLDAIDAPKLRMNLRTAEMTKHALNAFLATCISFGNEFASLCDEMRVDFLKVVDALKFDDRIGKQAPLYPGLAFSGGTLARDVKVVQELGDKIRQPTRMVDAVLNINAQQNSVILKKLQTVYGAVKGLTVGIMGLTYKPGTSTLRRSAAIDIINRLIKSGAIVKAYDPQADIEEVKRHSGFTLCTDIKTLAKGSDALVIVTEWPEFKTIDYNSVKSLMNKPVIIDGKNMLNQSALEDSGFTYLGIGRG